MIGKGRVFTPHTLDLIRNMAERGSSAIEIARSVGSTPGSVRVVCSLHKIKIRHGRSAANSVRMSEHMIVVHMPTPLFLEFYRKAEHLQMPVSILAGNLLAAITISDIYEAVLDDKE
jgi:hypothetical protein